jgi:DNA-directed RNA polymerase specialized sigma24 family protein
MDRSAIDKFLYEKNDLRADRLFGAVGRCVYPLICSTVRSSGGDVRDLEDLAQDVLIRFWQKLDTLRIAGIPLNYPAAYLRKIVRSVVLDKGVRREAKGYLSVGKGIERLFAAPPDDAPFRRWQAENGQWLFGLKEWQYDTKRAAEGQNCAFVSAQSLEEWVRFCEVYMDPKSPKADFIFLTALALKWLDHPARKAPLTELVCVAMGYAPLSITTAADMPTNDDDDGFVVEGKTLSSPESIVTGVSNVRCVLMQLPLNGRRVILLGVPTPVIREVFGPPEPPKEFMETFQSPPPVPEPELLYTRVPIKTDAEVAAILHTTTGNVQVLRNRAYKQFLILTRKEQQDV